MNKFDEKSFSRGQTTIELLVLLSVSLIALSLVYSLYFSQTSLIQNSQDATTAKSTVQKLVDAANTTYLSGKGSEIQVLAEIPQSVDLENSEIVGQSIIFKLKNGTDVIGTADVNLVGTLKSSPGKYLFYLRYDGDVVRLEYRDFEFNKQSIFASVIQGGDLTQSFTIRNNSESSMNFFIDNNFSHSLVTLNIDPADIHFSLNRGEIHTIDFNFETDGSAYGNYAGLISVTGEHNDVNTTKLMYVSVESYLEISDLMIYPKIITESVTGSHSQDYSVCNHSSSDITITDWIDLNDTGISFSDPSVSLVTALSCENFSTNFIFDQTGTLDANLTATYLDGNSYTTFMTFDVS
jgi:hypothetical protein